MNDPTALGRVIAHRGYSARAPENTRAAFEAAIGHGCDSIELDARLTRDHRAVVLHDDVLERYGHAGRAGDQALDELARLDAGSWFNARYAGETIVSLAQALAAIGGRVPINVEIKLEDEKLATDVVRATLDEIERSQVLTEIVFSTFSRAAFDAVGVLAPAAARALLVGLEPTDLFSGRDDAWWCRLIESLAGDGAEGLHIHRELVTPALVEATHTAGLALRAYTANTTSDMRRLVGIGVDGIFSDEVEKLRRVVDSQP